MKHASDLLAAPSTDPVAADPLPTDPITRKAALIASVHPWIASLAMRYALSFGLGDSNADEIYAVGRVEALRAADTFDQRQGAKFLTYIAQGVAGAMRRAAVALKQPVHIPHNRRMEVGIALAIPLAAPAGQFSRLGDGDDLEPLVNFLRIDDAAPDPFACADLSDRTEALTAALATLGERERAIFHGRFWQDRTLEAIGADYRLTRERIRQIERTALLKLRRLLVAGC